MAWRFQTMKEMKFRFSKNDKHLNKNSARKIKQNCLLNFMQCSYFSWLCKFISKYSAKNSLRKQNSFHILVQTPCNSHVLQIHIKFSATFSENYYASNIWYFKYPMSQESVVLNGQNCLLWNTLAGLTIVCPYSPI